MNADDRRLLDDCLRRIEAGESPAEALAQLPPADQARLAPLLSVALSLREQPLAPLRPAFRAGLQATLAELEEAVPVAAAMAPRRSVWQWAAAATLVMLVAALCSFGVAFAAGHSVPGDGLYPLKQAVERMWWTLAPADTRPELDRRLAAERVREAGVLLARGAEPAAVLAALDAARALVAADSSSSAALPAPQPVPRRLAPPAPSATPPPQAVIAAVPTRVPRPIAGRPRPPTVPAATVAPAPGTAAPTPTAVLSPALERPGPPSAATRGDTPTPAPSSVPEGVRIGGVVSHGGVPVAGATVAAWWVDPGHPCAAGGGPALQAQTLGDGSYVLNGLAPGTYQVSAEGGADCLPRRWHAGAAELAVPDPCTAGATHIELPTVGAAMSLANILFDVSAGGCPVAGE
jgi:hypothetical protein